MPLIRCARRLVPITLALVTAVFATAMAASPAATRSLSVAVTTKPVHSLVAAIMAGAGTPVLIVEGSASPHTFTLKPSSARAIHAADLFIRVSEDLEPFTRKLAESLPGSVTLMTLADTRHGVKLLDRRTSGTFEAHTHDAPHENKDVYPDHDAGHDAHADHDTGHDADHDEDHGTSGKDGHVWLDPENAKAIVQAVTEVLVAKAPGSAETFKANAAKLMARIDALAAAINNELAPVKDKPFIVFHDAYQYFESRFGLAAAGSITMSPDQQPSARRLTEVRKKIAGLSAACVFAEPGFQPKLVAAVTEGTSARMAALDPEGASLEAGPELYFVLLQDLARNMKACLSPQP
jgi:zinc transport system substrate-binding protein